MSQARAHHTLALVALGTLCLSSSVEPVAAPVATPVVAVAAPEPTPSVDHREDALEARVAAELAGRRMGLSRDAIQRLAHTLVTESRARGMDAELVLAVMQVESSFRPGVVSSAGAVGLMQVLPSTGEALAGRLGIVWRGPETLLDPDANVRLGIAYLDQLRARYGRLSPALAAYNWGPTRIDRRLGSGASLPQRYVHKVLGAWAEHARRATS